MTRAAAWIRRLLWLLAALGLLWSLAWLAVPPIARSQLESRLGELLGREVTVGEVGFEPWAMRLTVSDLAVAAAPGSAASAPQFTLARLRVDADARSLLRFAPVVAALEVDAPRLRIARTGEGRYDIDDLLARFASRGGEAPGERPRFVLNDLALRDGEIEFDDQPTASRHRITGLSLALPFLSGLPSQSEIAVEPHLAFTLDGASFDSRTKALPFAPGRNGEARLALDGLDLGPYAGYLPHKLPLRLQRGRLDADLVMAFAAPEGGAARVSISGRLALHEVALAERSGAPLLAWGQLTLEIKDLQPLARRAVLGELKIDRLQLHLDRDAQGRLGLERLAPPAAAGGEGTPAAAGGEGTPAAAGGEGTPAAAGGEQASAAAGSKPAPAAGGGEGAPPWQASLASFTTSGARIYWRDEAVEPASSWLFDAVDVTLGALHWPLKEPAKFTLAATLRPQADEAASLGRLALEGEASELAATARIEVSALALAAVAPYANLAQRARFAGVARAAGAIDWAAASQAQPMRLQVKLAQIGVEGIRIDEPGRGAARGDLIAAQRVQLDRVELDLATQAVAIGSAKFDRPALRVERGGDGQWNLMRLAGATPLEESVRPLVRAAAEATWSVRLDELVLDGGRVGFVDALPVPGHEGDPVRLDLDALKIGLQDLRLRGEQLVSTPRVQLSARITDATPGRDRDRPGQLDWRGRFGLAPAMLAGKLEAERLPADVLQAYARNPLDLSLERAEAGFAGELSFRETASGAPEVDFSGDLLLSDVKVVADEGEAADRELLSWQSFAVDGVKLRLRPGERPALAVREAVLSDYFANLVLTEKGELNLRETLPDQEADATAPASAPQAAGPASAPQVAGPASAPQVAAAASAPQGASAASAPQGATALPFDLDFGGLRLANGRVDFHDRFVKPNYSAALTELDGAVGAFRSGAGEAATLRLGGRIAGTGMLAIEGRIQPDAMPREIDIRAKASEIELAPFSTYSGKYAGYPIEHGKLSFQIHYQIDPAGKLVADHQLVLNQLTFGERVDSPSATKLPVLLAVALLKDSNGVIDIDLPVSGSLDDPEFSLFPIIVKVVVNLIGKALTAPFALLSGSGGPDLSYVAFEPGTVQMTEGGKEVVEKVAKKLQDRPALKLTVIGEADGDAERDAYRRAALEQRLAQEARREQLRASGAAATAASAAAPPPAGDERARLVKRLYREADLPDKPRNWIGMNADLATGEMEALLRKHVPAGAEAMRELALQRGLAVRDALLAQGLASANLFVGDPRLQTCSAEPNCTPRAQLKLDTR